MADEFPIGKWVNYNGAVTYASNVRTSAENLDIYISVNGSDGGHGTQSSPFKTIARARELVYSFQYLDQVRIYFMTPGIYESGGLLWNGTRFIGNSDRPGRLAFIGAESAKTIHLTGNVVAGSTQLSLNTTSLGGVGTHQRRFIVRKDVNGIILDERLISYHTDTTLTPSAPFNSIPVITDTFEIVTPNIVIVTTSSFTNFKRSCTGGDGYFSGEPVAGLFFVNLQIGMGTVPGPENRTLFNCFDSFIYCAKLYCPVFSDVRQINGTLLSGWVQSGPNYSNHTYLNFLGAPRDALWFGAGMIVENRIDAMYTGVIDGYFSTKAINGGSFGAHTSAKLVMRGGCLAQGTSGWLSWGICNSTLAFDAVNDWPPAGTPVLRINTHISGAKGLVTSPFSNLYLQYINFINMTGDVLHVSRGATIVINNATITGGASVANANGIVAFDSSKVIYHGQPVITCGAGGAEHKIADAVPITQPNSYFSAIGATMGPSAQGTLITRSG